jgi:hypothetical protein
VADYTGAYGGVRGAHEESGGDLRRVGCLIRLEDRLHKRLLDLHIR